MDRRWTSSFLFKKSQKLKSPLFSRHIISGCRRQLAQLEGTRVKSTLFLLVLHERKSRLKWMNSSRTGVFCRWAFADGKQQEISSQKSGAVATEMLRNKLLMREKRVALQVSHPSLLKRLKLGGTDAYLNGAPPEFPKQNKRYYYYKTCVVVVVVVISYLESRLLCGQGDDAAGMVQHCVARNEQIWPGLKETVRGIKAGETHEPSVTRSRESLPV